MIEYVRIDEMAEAVRRAELHVRSHCNCYPLDHRCEGCSARAAANGALALPSVVEGGHVATDALDDALALVRGYLRFRGPTPCVECAVIENLIGLASDRSSHGHDA